MAARRTSKNYSSYWTGVALKESGKVVPIKRVTRARSDQLAITRPGTARPGLEAFAAVISCNCFVRLF